MTKPQLEDQGKPLNRTGYAHIAFSVGSKEKVDELLIRDNDIKSVPISLDWHETKDGIEGQFGIRHLVFK